MFVGGYGSKEKDVLFGTLLNAMKMKCDHPLLQQNMEVCVRLSALITDVVIKL